MRVRFYERLVCAWSLSELPIAVATFVDIGWPAGPKGHPERMAVRLLVAAAGSREKRCTRPPQLREGRGQRSQNAPAPPGASERAAELLGRHYAGLHQLEWCS